MGSELASKAAPALRPYQEGVLVWEGRREVLRPRIRRKQPARPLTGQPEQRTREPSPRSRPLTVLVCLPKNAPCISISPAVSLPRTTRPGPPRLPSAVLGALVPSLPSQRRTQNPPPRRRRGCGVGAPAPPVPLSPLPAEPSSQTLDHGNKCHLDGEPRVRGPPSLALGASLRFQCAPEPSSPVAVFGPVPPTQTREQSPVTSAASISLPLAVRIAAKHRAARGPKSGKESAFRRRASQLADSPSPAQPLSIPTATFSLPSWFPLGRGERAPGREAWSGRAAARLRVAVRARAASREPESGWVGGEGGGERTGGERVGCGEGEGERREGGDSALLPLPAGAGGRRPRGGRGGGRGREGGSRGRRSDNPCVS